MDGWMYKKDCIRPESNDYGKVSKDGMEAEVHMEKGLEC
jgi:hypothetical protein